MTVQSLVPIYKVDIKIFNTMQMFVQTLAPTCKVHVKIFSGIIELAG